MDIYKLTTKKLRLGQVTMYIMTVGQVRVAIAAEAVSQTEPELENELLTDLSDENKAAKDHLLKTSLIFLQNYKHE